MICLQYYYIVGDALACRSRSRYFSAVIQKYLSSVSSCLHLSDERFTRQDTIRVSREPILLFTRTIAKQLLQYYENKSVFVSRGSVSICIAYFSRYVSQSVLLRLKDHFIYISYSCFGLRGSVRLYKSYISAIPIFNMEIASLQTFSELLK